MKKLLFVMTMLIASVSLSAQTISHVVQRGETKESVAKKYDVSVEDLVKANPSLNEYFYTGMTLIIPKPQINNPAPSEIEKESVEEISETKQDSYSKPKLDPFDYSFWGLNYTTPFKGIDSGIAGFTGHVMGIFGTSFGLTFSTGWQFKGITYGGGGVRFGLGPNFCYPISEHVFAYVPFCADLYGTMDDDDKWHFLFGLELLPSIGLKYGKFFVAGGFFLGWVQGSSSVTPGFNVSLGFDL